MRSYTLFGNDLKFGFYDGTRREITSEARAKRHWRSLDLRDAVDPSWDDVEAFVMDMPPPLERAVLARHNPAKPYGPGNCYWDYPKGQ